MGNVGIVLGGSGFIGFHLLRHLAASGRHTQLLSLDIKAPAERLPGVRYESIDLRHAIPEHLGHPDAVIYNLVALRNFPGHPHQDYYDTNVVSTQRAIDFAERTGAGTMVFTSTMSVYGAGEEPKDEGSPLAPTNPYGASKRICEVLNCAWMARNPTAKLVICRPAVIFGYRDDGNYTRLASVLERGVFAFVGRKDTIKSAGYVGDLVRSFTFCLDRPEREILYNFAYPHPSTIAEIVDDFCRAGTYRPFRVTLPLSLMAVAALPFEFLNALGVRNPIHRDRIRKLNESTHIVPKWLRNNGFEFKTDLGMALVEWKAQSPSGRFV